MKDFNSVVSTIHQITDRDTLEDFLLGITTPSEREELARRLEIIHQLLAGKPQQQIANDLRVGVATVTRGSKELATGRFKALRSRK